MSNLSHGEIVGSLKTCGFNWFYHNFDDIFIDTRCMLTALIKVFPWSLYRFDLFWYFFSMSRWLQIKKNQGSYPICQIVLFIQKADWWHLSALIVDVVTFDLIRGLKAFNKRKTPMRHLYTVLYLIIEVTFTFFKTLKKNVQRETIICKQK